MLIMSHFLTPVQSINFVTIICVLPLNLEPKEFAFPVNGTGVSPKSHIGQKERVQLVSSHGGGNNAHAAGDGSSPCGGCNKFQDGFSFLRNCSNGPLDVLTDRGMLV